MPTIERDPMYDEAVRVVLEMGEASAAALQRRLRFGRVRAERVLEMMEREGVISPGHRGPVVPLLDPLTVAAVVYVMTPDEVAAMEAELGPPEGDDYPLKVSAYLVRVYGPARLAEISKQYAAEALRTLAEYNTGRASL